MTETQRIHAKLRDPKIRRAIKNLHGLHAVAHVREGEIRVFVPDAKTLHSKYTLVATYGSASDIISQCG